MERNCFAILTLVFGVCFAMAVVLTFFALRFYQSTGEEANGRGIFFAGFILTLVLSTSLGFLFLAALSRLVCSQRIIKEEAKEEYIIN